MKLSLQFASAMNAMHVATGQVLILNIGPTKKAVGELLLAPIFQVRWRRQMPNQTVVGCERKKKKKNNNTLAPRSCAREGACGRAAAAARQEVFGLLPRDPIDGRWDRHGTGCVQGWCSKKCLGEKSNHPAFVHSGTLLWETGSGSYAISETCVGTKSSQLASFAKLYAHIHPYKTEAV